MTGPGDLPGAVTVGDDPAAVAELAAAEVISTSAAAVASSGTCRVALAGGSTPVALYALLATRYRTDVEWDAWQVFFGDERACPPTDPASNFRLATDHLLSRVPIAPGRVHRMRAEAADLDEAAREYAALLVDLCPPGPGGAPRLDLVLLGLGTNGHTASLFPGDPSLDALDTWAVRGRADYAPFDRITLTVPTLAAAATTVFCVTGAEKGQALRDVVGGGAPAARVLPVDGRLTWILDRAAAEAMGAA